MEANAKPRELRADGADQHVSDGEDESEREEWLSDKTEATVWVDGLDRIHKVRGINACIDLSATPYYLNRVGQEANRPFPWVVSDFGLIDAIDKFDPERGTQSIERSSSMIAPRMRLIA